MKEEMKITPMMQQWHECKKNAGEALLLFRLGDFYEAFHEDAHIISSELELTLTKRGDVPMCGVPWHTSENYIDKLIAKGFKVAIAEQMEDPKTVKGLVKRAIARIITPGTHVTSTLLREKNNQFIASIAQVGSLFGLCCSDPTTGEFNVEEFEDEISLFNALNRFQPKEILLTKKLQERHAKFLSPFYLTTREEWHFEHKNAYAFLTKHFQVHNLDCFGLKGKVAPINAAGALLTYLQEDLSLQISHIRRIQFLKTEETLVLDIATLRHLELETSFLTTLDYTSTPMGGRLLKQWIKNPLKNLSQINLRHDAVQELHAFPFSVSTLKPHLKAVRDLERLMMKIMSKLATPRDVLALADSLEAIDPIKKVLEKCHTKKIHQIHNALKSMRHEIDLIKNAIVEEPPLKTNEGGIFTQRYSQELDILRATAKGGKEWLLRYQNQIKEETGIKNLKIVYNKVFGYGIEVSRGQSKLMPQTFEKRQTLANSERYTSQALKEYESTIITAEERKNALELELFLKLLETLSKSSDLVFSMATAIAKLDVLLSFTELAELNAYVRPEMSVSPKLKIVKGRHPVIEQVIRREYFIPNDTDLDGDHDRLMLITGPNMGGKSTYIRQVALIVIMAQMGSFVPAIEAHVGVFDRIFTRIGASDDLSRGQSTFMVEMSETANILNNITKRSLVILDEIGRGTSTYDGLSIAWAVAEHLLAHEAGHSITLFATHYCELTELEGKVKGACNYQAAVKESQEEIHFMHHIVRGSADKSYGLHVAKLAGLPFSLIQRAAEILKQLEGKGEKKIKITKSKEEQLQFF